jgi:hypothetical protein
VAREDLCSAKFGGCQIAATTAYICPREQHRLWLCMNCHAVWRGMVQADPALIHRCPNCKDVGSGNAVPAVRPATVPAPLTGAVAEVLRGEMWQEGISADTIRNVLTRLALSAPWLESIRVPVKNA